MKALVFIFKHLNLRRLCSRQYLSKRLSVFSPNPLLIRGGGARNIRNNQIEKKKKNPHTTCLFPLTDLTMTKTKIYDLSSLGTWFIPVIIPFRL